MELYTLVESINPTVLLCSEKREFEAFGHTYVEHDLTDNQKILQNTNTGRCLEFNSKLTKACGILFREDDYDDGLNDLAGLANTIIINTGGKSIAFNAELTKRKNKFIMFIGCEIESLIRRILFRRYNTYSWNSVVFKRRQEQLGYRFGNSPFGLASGLPGLGIITGPGNAPGTGGVSGLGGAPGPGGVYGFGGASGSSGTSGSETTPEYNKGTTAEIELIAAVSETNTTEIDTIEGDKNTSDIIPGSRVIVMNTTEIDTNHY